MNPPTPYYDQDGITIYCGDNRKILPLLGRFDLLLTDPPYGIGMDTKRTQSWHCKTPKWPNARPTKDYGETEWDKPVEEWVLQLVRHICERQIIFGGNFYELPSASCWLVWDKDNGENNFADCELAWTNLNKAVRRIRYLWNGFQKEKPEWRGHPTQKPLDVLTWCLSHSLESRTVLDPWMGSGTTLVAAKLRGLRGTGIEINEDYCKIAVERLRQRVLITV